MPKLGWWFQTKSLCHDMRADCPRKREIILVQLLKKLAAHQIILIKLSIFSSSDICAMICKTIYLSCQIWHVLSVFSKWVPNPWYKEDTILKWNCSLNEFPYIVNTGKFFSFPKKYWIYKLFYIPILVESGQDMFN